MEEEMARANAASFDMDGDSAEIDTEEVFGQQVYETDEMTEAADAADFVELDQILSQISIDTDNRFVVNYMLVLSPFDLK